MITQEEIKTIALIWASSQEIDERNTAYHSFIEGYNYAFEDTQNNIGDLSIYKQYARDRAIEAYCSHCETNNPCKVMFKHKTEANMMCANLYEFIKAYDN